MPEIPAEVRERFPEYAAFIESDPLAANIADYAFVARDGLLIVLKYVVQLEADLASLRRSLAVQAKEPEDGWDEKCAQARGQAELFGWEPLAGSKRQAAWGESLRMEAARPAIRRYFEKAAEAISGVLAGEIPLEAAEQADAAADALITLRQIRDAATWIRLKHIEPDQRAGVVLSMFRAEANDA